MKILVTGANGFIGSAIVKALTGSNQVITSSFVGEVDHLVDLSSTAAVDSLVATVKPDAIVNAAGIVKGDSVQLNAEFSRNLALAAKAHDVSSLVVCSSAAVYGSSTSGLVAEDSPAAPVGAYAQSKLDEEAAVTELLADSATSYYLLRLFNVVGAGMGEHFLVPSLVKQLQVNGDVSVSHPDTKRDFVHVADVANVVAKVITGEAPSGVYNVGSGVATSLEQVVELVAASLGTEKPTIHSNAPTPDGAAAQADIAKLVTNTDWQPNHSLQQAIEEIVYEHRKD